MMLSAVAHPARIVAAQVAGMVAEQVKAEIKGGPGSGNFGHAGRPGEVGGSAPSGSSEGASSGEGESSHPKTYGDAVVAETPSHQVSTTPGERKMPWEMTQDEYEKLPIVYRGEGTHSQTEGNVFFSNDKEIAAAHGKVRDYRVLPGSKIYPDPEVQGEQGYEITGHESLQQGSAVINTDDVIRNYNYDVWKKSGKAIRAVKSIEGMAIDFEVRLSEAVTDFFNGDATAADVGRVMRQLIRSHAMDMFQEGMREGGIENPEDELSDEDEATVSNWISEQLTHVHDFILAMKDANKAEDRTAAQQGINNRVELWRGSLENLGSLGKASALKDVVCRWVIGETEQHCETCPHLASLKPHRLSWWLGNGYVPQQNASETLQCRGYRCLCTLRDGEDNQVMP